MPVKTFIHPDAISLRQSTLDVLLRQNTKSIESTVFAKRAARQIKKKITNRQIKQRQIKQFWRPLPKNNNKTPDVKETANLRKALLIKRLFPHFGNLTNQDILYNFRNPVDCRPFAFHLDKIKWKMEDKSTINSVKNLFPPYTKMRKGRWKLEWKNIKKWHKLQGIDLVKRFLEEYLEEHHQRETYKIANSEYCKHTPPYSQEIINHIRTLLTGQSYSVLHSDQLFYSEDDIKYILKKSDISKLEKEAHDIFKTQLNKEKESVYNNLREHQEPTLDDCMVHAWNAFLNFPYIQANGQLDDVVYCKWKREIMPVLRANNDIILKALQTYTAKIDPIVAGWMHQSADKIEQQSECTDEWMQNYQRGVLNFLSIANILHPGRQNEIILFTKIPLKQFKDDDGTRFDSSYGAIPINSRVHGGYHAICIKKNNNNELFVVDSGSPIGWEGVHPYDDYVREKKFAGQGGEPLQVLVKIKTKEPIPGKRLQSLSKNLESMYAPKQLRHLKICHTNNLGQSCPYTSEFHPNCGKTKTNDLNQAILSVPDAAPEQVVHNETKTDANSASVPDDYRHINDARLAFAIQKSLDANGGRIGVTPQSTSETKTESKSNNGKNKDNDGERETKNKKVRGQ